MLGSKGRDKSCSGITCINLTVRNQPEKNIQRGVEKGGEVHGHLVRSQLWMTSDIRLGIATMRANEKSRRKGCGMEGEQPCHFRQLEKQDDCLDNEDKAGTEEENIRDENHGLQAH